MKEREEEAVIGRSGMASFLIVSMAHLERTWAAEAGSWMPKSDVTFIVPYPARRRNRPHIPHVGPGGRAPAQAEGRDRQPGGRGWAIGTAEVAQAKPDGYKIGLSSANAAVFQALVTKLPFKTTADYQPILRWQMYRQR